MERIIGLLVNNDCEMWLFVVLSDDPIYLTTLLFSHKGAGLIQNKSALSASVVYRSFFAVSARSTSTTPDLHSSVPGGSRKRDTRRSVSTLADASSRQPGLSLFYTAKDVPKRPKVWLLA
jgi:hypothetical protein